MLDNREQILLTMDSEMRDLRRFDPGDVAAFLRAATAESALDLSDVVPSSVPSGLDVD